jgi:ADP-ribose pyrophosphatase YjhB (NUDIX family)
MLTFATAEGRFNCRVGGIVMSGRRMLLHRDPADPFWTAPGGRVEFGETSDDAIRREWAEALGTESKVGRLLWVAEDFFDYREERYHELLLLYALDLPPETPFPDGNRALCRLRGRSVSRDCVDRPRRRGDDPSSVLPA